MKQKRNIMVALLMVASLQFVWAQTVTFHQKDGQNYEIEVSKLDSVTFVAANQVVAESHTVINGRDWVDLGLPSGTLWATCNVGASSPEQFGMVASDLTGEDVATANWGSNWQTPTFEQMLELLNFYNTSWGWAFINDVCGILVISRHNGRSIFLPGFILFGGSDGKGYYFSSTVEEITSDGTQYFRGIRLGEGDVVQFKKGITKGYIRPVRVKE